MRKIHANYFMLSTTGIEDTRRGKFVLGTRNRKAAKVLWGRKKGVGSSQSPTWTGTTPGGSMRRACSSRVCAGRVGKVVFASVQKRH